MPLYRGRILCNITFPIFFCLICIDYACMYGCIYSIVGTCQAMVQQESSIFFIRPTCETVGTVVFSVATAKCTGLIKPWSNFGLLFCLTFQFFTLRHIFCRLPNHCLRIEDFFFLWLIESIRMLSTGIVGLQHAVAHVSNWWPVGQMWTVTSFYVTHEA